MSFSDPITQQDIAVLRSIGRKSINDFIADDMKKAEKWAYKSLMQLNVKSPFFRRNHGDWRENDVSPVKIIPVKDGKIDIRNRTVLNIDTIWAIKVDDAVVNDSIHYAVSNNEKKAIKKLLINIDSIIKNAIFLDSAISIKSSKNKKGNTCFMHYMYCPVEYNKAPFIAKITVEEYDIDGKNRAYNAQRIKMSDLPSAYWTTLLKEVQKEHMDLQADEITVADLHKLVKKYDKDFHPLPSKIKGKHTAEELLKTILDKPVAKTKRFGR